MQQDLWGNIQSGTPPKKKEKDATHPHTLVTLTPQDCLIFGHTPCQWDLSGQTTCSVCHIKIYCPICLQNVLPLAIQISCARHSQGGLLHG